MSVRSVKTSFTSSTSTSTMLSTLSMAAPSNVLANVDLNTCHHPPGLAPTWSPSEKGLGISLAGRPRSTSFGPHTSSVARNLGSNQWSGSTPSRSSNRSASKRYPPGMRLPSSSYHQTQNQYRRASFSGSQSRTTKFMDNGSAVQGSGPGSSLSVPVYQRTSRFDPFGDSKETTLSSSPTITASSSSTAQSPYTHYYYYDPSTNRPTLAYADEQNLHINTANLNASTNLLLDTLLNSRSHISRSSSPPTTQNTVIQTPAASHTNESEPKTLPKSRSPSPPHSPPRAAAISRPSAPAVPSADRPVNVSPPPPPPPAFKPVSKIQRDAIARIVASMLLNRADGVGRRARRCNGTGYVKSGLSRVVFVE